MKKLVSVLMLFVMVFALTSCGTKEPSGNDAAKDGYEIALITDKGNIDDKSFNQELLLISQDADCFF